MTKIKRKVGSYVILSPLAGGLTHDLMGVVLPHSVEVPCMKWEGATRGLVYDCMGTKPPSSYKWYIDWTCAKCKQDCDMAEGRSCGGLVPDCGSSFTIPCMFVVALTCRMR